MITLNINLKPEDLYVLMTLKSYTHIRIYRSDAIDGLYTEITTSLTRIPLVLGIVNYNYNDDVSPNVYYYEYSFGNNTSESDKSLPFRIQLGDPSKIGYTFSNYRSPQGVFGEVLTADDLRYSYLWGIDLIGADINLSDFTDEQIKYFITSAVQDFETTLTIDITRKIFKTRPIIGQDNKVDIWMNGINGYTNEEFPYDFDPDKWVNFGFLQLRHFPVINITRAELRGPTRTLILDLNAWIRLNKENGQVHFYPTNQLVFGPPLAGYGSVLLWQIRRYPQGIEIDYEVGYENSDKIDSGLREVIAKWAAIKLLIIGGGILPSGLSSQSVSLDGLSESLSFTQTPQSTTFAARIKQYSDDVALWLTKNRYKYAGIPLGFVTGS